MQVHGFRLLTLLTALLAAVAFGWSSPVAAQDEPVEVTLDELNDSDVSGTATLTANGDETDVSISVEGATGGHPIHIHQGTCDELNPNPEYVLTDIDAEGVSDTTVPVALSDLLDGEFAINGHESVDNVENYIVCGNIVGAAGGDATAEPPATAETGTGGVTDTASTGSGSAVAGNQSLLIIVLFGLALSLAAAGTVLRARDR